MKIRFACLALLLAPALSLAHPGEADRVRTLHPKENLYAGVHWARGETRELRHVGPAHDDDRLESAAPGKDTHRTWLPPQESRDAPAPVAAPEVSPANALMALTFFGFALAVARGRRRRTSSF